MANFKYVVYQCSNCGLPQLARNDHLSRLCVKCNVTNSLHQNKVKILLQTNSQKEAFEAVAYAKLHRELFSQLPGVHGRRRVGFLRRVNK